MTDWTLTISPDEDRARPGLRGYRATCSCGYRSPLQINPDAFKNVAMAAAQHLEHRHRRPGDPALDRVGIEVVELKAAGWSWRCHACDEQEFHQPDEATAWARADEHGRSYRHHRRAAA